VRHGSGLRLLAPAIPLLDEGVTVKARPAPGRNWPSLLA